jgi:hypothetical protein
VNLEGRLTSVAEEESLQVKTTTECLQKPYLSGKEEYRHFLYLEKNQKEKILDEE